MVDDTYLLSGGDAIQAFDRNVVARALTGYAVEDGAMVTVNTGELGSGNNALSVTSGSAVVARSAYDIGSQAVDLPGADAMPRWDVVGVDDTGAVVTRSGTPEEAQIDGEPTDASGRLVQKPVPPSIDGESLTTALALVWMPADASTIESSDIYDVRVPANAFVSNLSLPEGGQVDGVDVSAHAGNADAHHTQTTSGDIVHGDTQGGGDTDAHHAQTHDNADHTEVYTVGDYEIQVDGTDGQGIINFITQ